MANIAITLDIHLMVNIIDQLVQLAIDRRPRFNTMKDIMEGPLKGLLYGKFFLYSYLFTKFIQPEDYDGEYDFSNLEFLMLKVFICGIFFKQTRGGKKSDGHLEFVMNNYIKASLDKAEHELNHIAQKSDRMNLISFPSLFKTARGLKLWWDNLKFNSKMMVVNDIVSMVNNPESKQQSNSKDDPNTKFKADDTVDLSMNLQIAFGRLWVLKKEKIAEQRREEREEEREEREEQRREEREEKEKKMTKGQKLRRERERKKQQLKKEEERKRFSLWIEKKNKEREKKEKEKEKEKHIAQKAYKKRHCEECLGDCMLE